jgi:hypothetical protein
VVVILGEGLLIGSANIQVALLLGEPNCSAFYYSTNMPEKLEGGRGGALGIPI